MAEGHRSGELGNGRVLYGKGKRQLSIFTPKDGSAGEAEAEFEDELEESDDSREEDEDEEESNEEEEDTAKGLDGAATRVAAQLEDMSSDDEMEKCPICLHSFQEQPVATPTGCQHHFCLDCILEWAKNANSCPVDRISFSSICLRKCYGGEVQKLIPVQEPVKMEEEEEVDVDFDQTCCEVCGRSDREDRLLLCDGCDAGYHMECLSPPLDAVPVEEWFCPQCTANNAHSDSTEEVSEDEVAALLADVVPTTSRLRASTVGRTRSIARTRQSERVRATINRNRITQAHAAQHVPRCLIRSTWLDETINAVLNSAAYAHSITRRGGARRKRKIGEKHRKSQRKKDRAESSSSSKRTVGKDTKIHREHLKRAKFGQKQVVKKHHVSRSHLPRSLEMHSGLIDLGSLDDANKTAGGSVPHMDVRRRGLSHSALRSHQPVAQPIQHSLSSLSVSDGDVMEDAAPVPDLLGSILSGQSLFLKDISDMVITRDGSLKLGNPVSASSKASISNTNNTHDSETKVHMGIATGTGSCAFHVPSLSHSPPTSDSLRTSASLVVPPVLRGNSSSLNPALQRPSNTCISYHMNDAGSIDKSWCRTSPTRCSFPRCSNSTFDCSPKEMGVKTGVSMGAVKKALHKPVWMDISGLPRIPKIQRGTDSSCVDSCKNMSQELLQGVRSRVEDGWGQREIRTGTPCISSTASSCTSSVKPCCSFTGRSCNCATRYQRSRGSHGITQGSMECRLWDKKRKNLHDPSHTAASESNSADGVSESKAFDRHVTDVAPQKQVIMSSESSSIHDGADLQAEKCDETIKEENECSGSDEEVMEERFHHQSLPEERKHTIPNIRTDAENKNRSDNVLLSQKLHSSLHREKVVKFKPLDQGSGCRSPLHSSAIENLSPEGRGSGKERLSPEGRGSGKERSLRSDCPGSSHERTKAKGKSRDPRAYFSHSSNREACVSLESPPSRSSERYQRKESSRSPSRQRGSHSSNGVRSRHGSHRKRGHESQGTEGQTSCLSPLRSPTRSRSTDSTKAHMTSRSRSGSVNRRKGQMSSETRSKSTDRRKSHLISQSRSRATNRNKDLMSSPSRSKSFDRIKDQVSSISTCMTKDWYRSKDRKKSRSRSKDRKRSRSRSKDRKRSRSRSKDRKRSRSRSKDRKRSRSRSKDRKRSRSRSLSGEVKNKRYPSHISHSTDLTPQRTLSEVPLPLCSKDTKGLDQTNKQKPLSSQLPIDQTDCREMEKDKLISPNRDEEVNKHKELKIEKTASLSKVKDEICGIVVAGEERRGGEQRKDKEKRMRDTKPYLEKTMNTDQIELLSSLRPFSQCQTDPRYSMPPDDKVQLVEAAIYASREKDKLPTSLQATKSETQEKEISFVESTKDLSVGHILKSQGVEELDKAEDVLEHAVGRAKMRDMSVTAGEVDKAKSTDIPMNVSVMGREVVTDTPEAVGNLTGAVVTDTPETMCNLPGAVITDTLETVCNLPGAVITDTLETVCNLPGAVITDTPESMCNLPGAVITDTLETVCNLPGAVITDTPETVCNLPGAVITGTPETVCNLPGAVITDTPETVCNLPGAVITDKPETVCNLPGAVIRDTPETVCNLPRAVIRDTPETVCNLPGAVIIDTPETVCNLPGAVITDTPETVCNLPGAVVTDTTETVGILPGAVVTKMPETIGTMWGTEISDTPIVKQEGLSIVKPETSAGITNTSTISRPQVKKVAWSLQCLDESSAKPAGTLPSNTLVQSNKDGHHTSANLTQAQNSSRSTLWFNRDQNMKTLHLQERAIEEVKQAIKPFFQKKEITVKEFKEIWGKAVQKVCDSRSGEISPERVSKLVKAYVEKYKLAKKTPNGGAGPRSDRNSDMP